MDGARQARFAVVDECEQRVLPMSAGLVVEDRATTGIEVDAFEAIAVVDRDLGWAQVKGQRRFGGFGLVLLDRLGPPLRRVFDVAQHRHVHGRDYSPLEF